VNQHNEIHHLDRNLFVKEAIENFNAL
jgi:hypothetical protein